MTQTDARRLAVQAATDIAEAVGTGTLAPEDIRVLAMAELSELQRTVAGPGDPFWEQHVSVFRQVLALGAPVITGAELSEWAAVYSHREADERDRSPAPSWIEQTLERLAKDDEQTSES